MKNDRSEWERCFLGTKAHIEQHGRTPDAKSELGEWAHKQREELLNASIDRGNLEAIQREIPQILFDGSPTMLNEMLWLEKLFEMADYVELHKKMPCQSTTFGRWAIKIVKSFKAGEMCDSRMNRFVAELPFLRETKEEKSHKIWLRNLDKAAKIVHKTGELPKGLTSEATWTRKLIKSIRLGQIDDVKLAAIEELCPLLLMKAGKISHP